MSWLLDFYRSAMGKKAVMAVTGIILFGFVAGHMVGNLKLYQHDVMVPDLDNPSVTVQDHKIDVYAEGLRSMGQPFFGHSELLWIVRLGLLVALLLHILSAWQLTRLSWKARPASYVVKTSQKTTLASRTMRWGGVVLAAFIVFHLLHLTTGDAHHDFQPGEVFHNVVSGFQVTWVAGFYIIANLFLGLHLYHGVWSLFQTLGLSGPRMDVFRKRFAQVFAIVITVGNLSFPLAVLGGLVKL